ncbi:hypothetical protein T492DRAFT_855404 [Pavlovales sp. CCMP2436]|nr:hypothetical protein T492DRAFT_855404 [Pavlovales sp. CCMP2436]
MEARALTFCTPGGDPFTALAIGALGEFSNGLEVLVADFASMGARAVRGWTGAPSEQLARTVLLWKMRQEIGMRALRGHAKVIISRARMENIGCGGTAHFGADNDGTETWMVLTGWNKGSREITTKAKAIVLAKSAIDKFSMANPTIKARLKSLDESDAAAARTIFLSWLTNRGAINLPANSNNSHCVCTWCGECRRSNSCERGCHVACSTAKSCSVWNPQQAEFRVKLAGTQMAAKLGKERQSMFGQASQEAEDAAEELLQGKSAGKKRAAKGLPAGSSQGSKTTKLGNLLGHMDRVLTQEEINEVDEGLRLQARSCYANGIPFKYFACKHFRKALGKLNQSWLRRTRLSDWTLRHNFLDNENERATERDPS